MASSAESADKETRCWAKLILLKSDEERTFEITTDRVTIGRSLECELRFDDVKALSSKHCFIERKNGEALLHDCSKNGTLVNADKLKDGQNRALKDGDEIRLAFRAKEDKSGVSLRFRYVRDDEPPSKRVKLDETQEMDESAGADESKKNDSETEEALICAICREIFHTCVSVQPCMHSFCGGCISEWIGHSENCPACRKPIERICKNHIVNNLVEIYLKKEPQRQRSVTEKLRLDELNKIKDEALKLGHRHHGHGGGSMDGSGSESSDDSDGESGGIVFSAAIGYGGNRLRAGVRPSSRAHGHVGRYRQSQSSASTAFANTLCRQCPGYAAPPSSSGSDQPTTSAGDDAKVMPTPPTFQCQQYQTHVLCQCCLQPMPDRRVERNRLDDESIPQQHCTICYRVFCHTYWGCMKNECYGCLGRFKEMNFGQKCLKTIVNNNPFESAILKDWMTATGKNVKQLLQECAQKLDAGEYTCSDQSQFSLTSNSVVCYGCGVRNFRDLAFQFRRDLAADQLPAYVRSRSDCYWGKGCRTQFNKPDHAKRFNHVCEATRTS